MIFKENKHALSCVLPNNLRDGEILFEISTPRRLLCNNHENKHFISILPRQQNGTYRFPLQENEVGQAVTSYLKINCRERCFLLHPRDFWKADDWFSF